MTRFPAKLLLFGEYSILLGSSALSIPFKKFGASLEFINRESGHQLESALESNLQLSRLGNYFAQHEKLFGEILDIKRFNEDITRRLYCKSDIPQRYGMGSSGALCAALFHRFGKVQCDMEAMRTLFMRMESFFHGKSSGFDPLLSWFGTPLLLDRSGVVNQVDPEQLSLAENGLEMMLIDSGVPCSTGPLVTNFLHKFQPGGKTTSTGDQFCKLVDDSNYAMRTAGGAGFWEVLTLLSGFQLVELNHLIPIHLRPAWEEGLNTGMFSLKLCGSGGGGFLLCFTRKGENTINWFRERNLEAVSVPM
ncbi:MAG: mevalonate kinase family protein [Bacteroidales bacterium]